MRNPFSLAPRSPLAQRLIVGIVLVSAAIALLLTVIQLYGEYRYGRSSIDHLFDQIERVHVTTLSQSLWATNAKELQLQVDGIIKLSDIRYVAVHEDARMLASAGRRLEGNNIEREYPLTYDFAGKHVRLGTLTVVVTLDNLYTHLLNQALIILGTNALKTFLVAGFILVFFHRLINRHLLAIVAYLQRLTPDRDAPLLTLDRTPRKRPDELDQLAAAFNAMLAGLKQRTTERDAAYRSLQDSENRISLLLDSTAEAIYGTDLEGHCTFANQACIRMLGYENEQALLGHPMQALIHRADRDAAGRHDTPRHVEDEMLWRKDGSAFPAEYWSHPIHHQGQLIGAVVTFVDITLRKQAEAQVQELNSQLEQRVRERTAQLESANKELEAFSYSVSHDLRAPLRAVDGFSQALLEDYAAQLDATGKDYLQRVRNGAQNMGTLIDDMLKLARVTRAPLQAETLNLSAIAQDIVKSLQEGAAARDVRIEIAPDLHGHGDRGLLQVVLENLLSNAWKYSSKTAHAHISFAATTQNGVPVFCVRDNGVGFDMALATHLFGAFQRLHHRGEFEGNGIGLATVSRIIQRHGGKVWAEASPGAGAAFFFTLGQAEA